MSDAPSTTPAWERLSLRGWVLLLGACALVAAGWASVHGTAQAPKTRRDAPAPALPTRLVPDELTEAEADREAAPVAGYRRDVVRPRPVQNLAEPEAPKDDSSPVSAPGGPASRRRDEKKTLPEIFRMPGEVPLPPPAAAPTAPEKAVPAPALADAFAPFGRLVKCELLETIDSITARSEPILALVTEDVDWNGNVIIPAGSEAFSYAAPEAVLDADGVGRLVDNGEWTLVLPGGTGENGRELALKGRAVNRLETVVDSRGEARSWGIDDGADGLIGYTLSSLDDREIRLFAAAAVSGLAQGFGAIAQRQVPAAGVSGLLGATQVAPTVGNAVVGSLSTSAVDAANEMAARIKQEITKRGAYVRVPAGKAFYLFVEQTIDPRLAQVGLRLPAGARAAR
jgi:hypothetical protein